MDGDYVMRHIATVRVLVILAASILFVATGCQRGDGAAPAPATGRSPSPVSTLERAVNSSQVCLAVTGVLRDGSAAIGEATKLAVNGQLSREDLAQRLRDQFAKVGAGLQDQAPRAADPALRATIEKWAARMRDGATASDATAFFTDNFSVMLNEIGAACRVG
jgi:type IV secretory pathway TrbL component